MLLDSVPQLVPMSFQRLATGFDDAVEAGSAPVGAGSVLSRRILPDVEAQEEDLMTSRMPQGDAHTPALGAVGVDVLVVLM